MDNSSGPNGFGPGGMFGGGMQGGGFGSRGGDRFTQWDQSQDRPQDGAADTTFAISPDALPPVGVSVLFLLAGLVIAFKVKH